MIMWLKEVFKRFFGHEEKKLIVEQPEVACELQEKDTELYSKPCVEQVKKTVKKSGKKRGRPRKKVKREEV